MNGIVAAKTWQSSIIQKISGNSIYLIKGDRKAAFR
jgi:hypothetical protein